jgi:hypothetical protein
MAQMENLPALTASTTASFSIRSSTLATGMTTPWLPSRPRSAARSKYPSILALMPPTGWTRPFWSMEPVTEMPWASGASPRRERRA